MHATTQQRSLVDTRSARTFLIAATIFLTGAAIGAAGAVVAEPAARAQTVIVAGDHSYDALEDARAGGGVGAVTGDRSYDAIEENRMDIGTTRLVTVPSGDRSYDAIEEARAAR